jgi:hypothetical protein
MKNRDYWNRCDMCGRFISYNDFDKKKASRILILPESEVTDETYETVCKEYSCRMLINVISKFRRN